MSIVAAISNVQTPSEIVFMGGLTTISLIISLFIAIMISDSKYWDKWARSTIEACTFPLIIIFVAIIVFKISLS